MKSGDNIYIIAESEKTDRVLSVFGKETARARRIVIIGGGTTAFNAEKYGRRWITIDTSRIAISLAKLRLLTSTYEYYKLKSPDIGVSGGFEYKTGCCRISVECLWFD